MEGEGEGQWKRVSGRAAGELKGGGFGVVCHSGFKNLSVRVAS